MIPVTKTKDGLDYSHVAMDNYVRSLKDGTYILELTSTTKRSKAQLKYYRGVVVPTIAKYVGEYPNVVHDFLAGMLLKTQIEIMGQVVETVRSTSDGGGMSVDEFRTFLDQVIQYAAESGIDIPPPHKYGIE